MLALALLLAQPAFSAEPPPESHTEIVVFARRLEQLRFSASVRRGQVRCRVTRSSGDPALDAIACPAVGECAARRLRSSPEIEACIRERLRIRYQALR